MPTRKRWVRLLYQGRTQLRLVAEGSSVERFAYWEPMFFTAFRTVKFGDWAADAVGVEWADRWFQEDPAGPSIEWPLPGGRAARVAPTARHTRHASRSRTN